MVVDGDVKEPHLRMEEAEFEAGVGLRTGREVQALEQHFIAYLVDQLFGDVILRHRHAVFGRGDGHSVAGVAVVAYGSCSGEGEVVTEFDGDSCLDTHVTLADLGERLVDEGTGLIIVVTVELGSVPTLGEESGNTTTYDRVVELIGQVGRCDLLAGCIEICEVLSCIMYVDLIDHAVMDTLRDISIAYVRRACLCDRVEFQAVTTVDLVGCAELESRINEMVGSTVIGATIRIAVLIDVIAEILIHRTAPESEVRQEELTAVGHSGGTLHGVIIDRQGVVEVHLVEGPFILEPSIEMTHVHPVVVAEAVSLMDLHIGMIVVILNDGFDIFLGETGGGSQLLDVTISESIDVDPFVGAEQVVHGLVMDTLRELTLYAQRHFQMLVLGVHVVEHSVCLLDIVMTALEEVTCYGIFSLACQVGVVSGIECIPVDLGGLVIACFPEVHQVVVLLLVNRRTYEVAVLAYEAGAEVVERSVLTDEESPGIVLSLVVIELGSTAGLTVGVRDLTVPHSGRQVAIVVRTGVGRIVVVDRRIGIHRIVVSGRYFEALVVIDLVLEGGYSGRVVGFDDTRVAYVTVLVTPCRVIVDRTGQVIHLLGDRQVLSTLGRSTEGEEFQAGIVPYLLCRQIVAERVVIDTFSDDAFLVDVGREAIR